MRKVTLELKVRVDLRVDEGQPISDVVDNLDYSFVASPDTNATVVDTEILDSEIKDSR